MTFVPLPENAARVERARPAEAPQTIAVTTPFANAADPAVSDTPPGFGGAANGSRDSLLHDRYMTIPPSTQTTWPVT